MKTSNQSLVALDIADLDHVSGGTRNAPSATDAKVDDTLGKLDSLLEKNSGGGMEQFMTMFMQMMMRKNENAPSEVTSPGLMGALFGGTTTVK